VSTHRVFVCPVFLMPLSTQSVFILSSLLRLKAIISRIFLWNLYTPRDKEDNWTVIIFVFIHPGIRSSIFGVSVVKLNKKSFYLLFHAKDWLTLIHLIFIKVDILIREFLTKIEDLGLLAILKVQKISQDSAVPLGFPVFDTNVCTLCTWRMLLPVHLNLGSEESTSWHRVSGAKVLRDNPTRCAWISLYRCECIMRMALAYPFGNVRLLLSAAVAVRIHARGTHIQDYTY